MDELNIHEGSGATENAVISKLISREIEDCGGEEYPTVKSSIGIHPFLEKLDDNKVTSPSPSISISFSCESSLTCPKQFDSPDDELEYLLTSKVEDAFLTEGADIEARIHPKANIIKNAVIRDKTSANSFECDPLSLSPINVFSSTFPTADNAHPEGYSYFSPEDAAYCNHIFGFDNDSHEFPQGVKEDQNVKMDGEQNSISQNECKKGLPDSELISYDAPRLIPRAKTKPSHSCTKSSDLVQFFGNTGNQYASNQYASNDMCTSIRDMPSTKYLSPFPDTYIPFQPSTKYKHALVTPLHSFNDNEFSTPTSVENAVLSSTNHQVHGTTKNDVVWNRRFRELIEFKEVHGHTNVPQKFEKNPSLGAWVARSRLQMRQMEEDKDAANNLSEVQRERVRRLKEIGVLSGLGKGAFGRTNGHLMSSRNARDWEKQFNALKEYKDLHGDCDVPVKSAEFKSLGRWVSAQRKKYRQYSDEGANNKPSNDLISRFERLREIGFSFCIGSGKSKRARCS